MKVRNVLRDSRRSGLSALRPHRSSYSEVLQAQQRCIQTQQYRCLGNPSAIPERRLLVVGSQWQAPHALQSYRAEQRRTFTACGSNYAPGQGGGGWGAPAFGSSTAAPQLTPDEQRIRDELRAEEEARRARAEREQAQVQQSTPTTTSGSRTHRGTDSQTSSGRTGPTINSIGRNSYNSRNILRESGERYPGRQRSTQTANSEATSNQSGPVRRDTSGHGYNNRRNNAGSPDGPVRIRSIRPQGSVERAETQTQAGSFTSRSTPQSSSPHTLTPQQGSSNTWGQLKRRETPNANSVSTWRTSTGEKPSARKAEPEEDGWSAASQRRANSFGGDYNSGYENQNRRPRRFNEDDTRNRNSPSAEYGSRSERPAPRSAQNDFVAEVASQELAYTSRTYIDDEDDRSNRKSRKKNKYEAPDTSSKKGGRKEKGGRGSRFLEEGEEDDYDLERELLLERKAAKKQRRAERQQAKAEALTPILLPEFISVANLATALHVKFDAFIYKMEELGFEEHGADHILNAENAGLIAMEFGYEPIVERGESEDLKPRPPAEDPSSLPPRPPVVTIMGHVDHGKTTILDWLRKSSVAATEHGGITQHIGAFSVGMTSGKTITFLDTPGHAAFLSMRQRGANVTDIVVLVVAADDSVKPQTLEALNHAVGAKVPIIVAINKIDKPEADIQRVKGDVARAGVEIEDYGGDTQVVCVSGKTGQGMEELEESILTLSEMLDMRAETDGPVEGWILETKVKEEGKVASVLVKRGTLRVGDFIVAGKTWARVRGLRNEAGISVEEAPPGTPIEVLGWREQPAAGDQMLQAPDEDKAKDAVEFRINKEEMDKLAIDMEAINSSRKEEQEKRERLKYEAEMAKKGLEVEEAEEKDHGPKVVPFIVKGDVHGSVEAVNDSVLAIGSNEVRARVLRSGVGQISKFDVEHAATAGGCIINFNLPVDPEITRLAEVSKVPILDFNIIYHLVDAVKAKLSELLPPLITTRVIGEVEIAQIFDINLKRRKTKPVAGCRVKNGVIYRNSKVRVLRKGKIVYEGTLESLKNVKKDVTEARKGGECGMEFAGWSEFEVDDQIQAYEEREEKRYL